MLDNVQEFIGFKKEQPSIFSNKFLNVFAIIFIATGFALGYSVSSGHGGMARYFFGVLTAAIAGLIVGLASLTRLGNTQQ